MIAMLPRDPDLRSAWLADAFKAGDQARDEGTITPGAHMLYERMLRLTKEHTYVWAGLKKLGELLGCCAKTISRRFDELLAAGLVWRERRLNRTWLTYFTALAGSPPEQAAFFEPATVSTVETEMSSPPRDQNREGGGSNAPASFEETTESPSPISAAPPPQEAVAELRDAGLLDETTIAELAHKPISLIRRAVAYVKGQRRGGPGLIAWLLRNDKPIPEEHHGRRENGADRVARRAPSEADKPIAERTVFHIIGLPPDESAESERAPSGFWHHVGRPAADGA